MIILDTNVLIEIDDRESRKGGKALRAILDSGEEAVTTSINMHELRYGLRKYAEVSEDVLQFPVPSYGVADKTFRLDSKSKQSVKVPHFGGLMRSTLTAV